MEKKNRPNVIVITTDQQRIDSLSCYGAEHMSTPNIDRLAAEGARCDRAYTVNPVCTPSRVSLITGQYPSRHGAWNVGTMCPDGVPLIGEELGQAGYRTHLIGKAHLQSYESQFLHKPHGAVESKEAIVSNWQKPKEWLTPADWTGPYYGYQSVEFAIGHGKWGHYGHYREWIKSKISEEEIERLNKVTPRSDTVLTAELASDWDWPVELHNSVWTAERAIEFLKEQNGEEPFMLSIGFQDPHHPHCVPKDFADKVDPADVPLPKHRDGELDSMPEHFALARQAKLQSSKYVGRFSVTGQGAVKIDNDTLTEHDIRVWRAYYYSLVKLIDQQMGRILDCLDEQGLTDNTIVIFTTDHGELLGDHGLWMKGPFHYEEAVNIPFLVRWPGRIPAGTTIGGLLNLADVAPTLLSAAGLETPEAMEGVNILPLLQGETDRVRDFTIVECVDDTKKLRLKSVITPTRKLTCYHGQSFGELFDLDADPDEFTNLWDDPSYAADKAELMSIILDHMERLEHREPRNAYV